MLHMHGRVESKWRRCKHLGFTAKQVIDNVIYKDGVQFMAFIRRNRKLRHIRTMCVRAKRRSYIRMKTVKLYGGRVAETNCVSR